MEAFPEKAGASVGLATARVANEHRRGGTEPAEHGHNGGT
jgi:hypothetical protein